MVSNTRSTRSAASFLAKPPIRSCTAPIISAFVVIFLGGRSTEVQLDRGVLNLRLGDLRHDRVVAHGGEEFRAQAKARADRLATPLEGER